MKNPTVFTLWLDNLDGVVVEIIVDETFSESVVLEWTFDHTFLEIGSESEHLPIIFKPRGLDSRDVIVFWFLSLAVSHAFACSISHFI